MENQNQKAEQLELGMLMAKTVLRDQTAFKDLYDKTAHKVYGLILKMLGNKALAEDLLQDVYLRVWSQASQYQADKGPVVPWLLTVARYRALDLLRAEKRRENAMTAHEENFSLENVDAPGNLSEELTHCLGRLAGEQLQSILQAFFFGLTHEELARRLSTPIGTVKSRIRRGLARLKECLEE